MNNHFGISVLWIWIEQATKGKEVKESRKRIYPSKKREKDTDNLLVQKKVVTL